MKDKPKSEPAVQVSPGNDVRKPVRRPFPGPAGAKAALRVAIERQPHADLAAHARESLHAEVCGVLVGHYGEDDEGTYTHVTAVIRGTAAAEGSTHVTFTQATWNAIHAAMDKDHKDKQIVGWYHTHPGFGVEFSDMDIFIQRNFFSGPSQVALVTDPTTGAVAIAMNAKEGIRYLPRYWVDGREHPAQDPAPAAAEPEASNGKGKKDKASAAKQADVDQRFAHLTQAIDDLRSWLHNFLLFIGAMVAIGVIAAVYFLVREQFRARVTPPEVGQSIPIPIKIGDKTVIIGVGITQWQVPEELNAIIIETAKAEAEARAKAEAERTAQAPPAAPAPEAPPAAGTPPAAGAPPAPAAPPATPPAN